MFELIRSGGWLIWPIILCSVISLTIIIERFITLKRRTVTPQGLMPQIETMLSQGQLNSTKISAIRGSSPLGKILAAGLVNLGQHRVVIKEAIEEAGRHVVHDMERYLNTLGTIAAITPLLGLLGTVIGMIKVFSAITSFGVGNPSMLAGGISEALITTAAGLSVGIPSLLFYRYFRGRINDFTIEMEREALHFLELVQEKRS